MKAMKMPGWSKLFVSIEKEKKKQCGLQFTLTVTDT